MKKRAIIVGAGGQDGRLLHELLKEYNYDILGIARGRTYCDRPNGNSEPIDISDGGAVQDVVGAFQPEEIYYLAAFHHSSQDTAIAEQELFRRSFDVHVAYLIHFLEAIRRVSPRTRLFYAASSHIFGETLDGLQDERTPVNPGCIYGITKAAGLFTCRYYREKYGVFASVGIMYNHESIYREAKFVSRKIIKSAVDIKANRQEKLILGDLDAVIDWGYAPDYVKAMHGMLNIDHPDDFIVATGLRHTVRDFVQEAFGYLGLDWTRYVVEQKGIITKKNSQRIGCPAKIKQVIGWEPLTEFGEMIRLLLIEEEKGIENKPDFRRTE